MIKENNFFIKDLKKVVIIGACPNIEKILKINYLKIKNLNYNQLKSKKLF